MKTREIVIYAIFAVIILVGSIGFIRISKYQHEKEAEKVKTEEVDDFLKVYEYEAEPTVGDYSGNSYWFVVAQKKDDFGTMYNSFIKQPHPYFSYKEMKKEFKDPVFLINLVRVSKETYEANKN